LYFFILVVKGDKLVGFYQSNGPANGISCFRDIKGKRFVFTSDGRTYID
jgi:hypothetical protein